MNGSWRIIYLQPLGPFPEQLSPSLEKLREYAAGFFQMEVKALAPVTISAGSFTSRTNSMTGRRQILTGDVVKRYEALAQFERRAGLEDEAAWVDRRLEKIRHGAGS